MCGNTGIEFVNIVGRKGVRGKVKDGGWVVDPVGERLKILVSAKRTETEVSLPSWVLHNKTRTEENKFY